MCFRFLTKSCCGSGGWFDKWQSVGTVSRDDENHAQVRYPSMLPVSIVGTQPFNSFTSREYSTHPSEPVAYNYPQTIYENYSRVWVRVEDRGDEAGSDPGHWTVYAAVSGDEYHTEVYNFSEDGGTPIFNDCYPGGLYENFYGISRVFAKTAHPDGSGHHYFATFDIDVFSGGTLSYTSEDIWGVGATPFLEYFNTVMARALKVHIVTAEGVHSDTASLPCLYNHVESILTNTSLAAHYQNYDLTLGTPLPDPLPPGTIECNPLFYKVPSEQTIGVGDPFYMAAQVGQVITEAWSTYAYQGYPSACSVRFNAVGLFTSTDPTISNPCTDASWESTKSHTMFLQLKVGTLVHGPDYSFVQGTVAVEVEAEATYNGMDSEGRWWLSVVYPIHGEWLQFDARGNVSGATPIPSPVPGDYETELPHWAGVVRYDTQPTYGNLPVSDVGVDPVHPTRLSKVALLIDGQIIHEFTFDGFDVVSSSTTGWGYVDATGQNVHSGANVYNIAIGVPNVCAHGVVAVVRKVYSVNPNSGDPEGTLLDDDKPWAFCLYQGGLEIYRSPLLFTPPTFFGFTKRWIYFRTDGNIGDLEMTDGNFQDRPNTDVGDRLWIVNYNGTEVVPLGQLTDDPTVINWPGDSAELGPSEYGAPWPFQMYYNTRHNLPGSFADMFAQRYVT